MIVIIAGKTVKGPIHVSIEGAEHSIPDVAQRPERADSETV